MPRFFFDFTDEPLLTDDTGVEFVNAQAAHEAGIRALPDIVRDKIGTDQTQAVVLVMRDDTGRALLRASLTLRTEWLVETP